MTDNAQDKVRRAALRAALDALKVLADNVKADDGWGEQAEAVSSASAELIDAFEDADIAAQCEGCSDGIIHGEMGTTTSDGCSLCAICAPTWADCKSQWDEFPDQGDEGDYERLQAEYAAHIAAGGSPDDKPLYVMGDP